jgi:hypothetical protein
VFLRDWRASPEPIEHPIDILLYGLAQLERLRQQPQHAQARRLWRAQLDWTLHRAVWREQDCAVWPCAHAHSVFPLPSGWISAFAQSLAICLLLRSKTLVPASERAELVRVARAALAVFRLPTAQGGVRAELPGCGAWFEEYPTQPPSLVLNGHIYACFGLHDLWRLDDNRPAGALFADGMAALERGLSRFELGSWSRYDLFPWPAPNPASPYYHGAHVHLLNVVHRLTGMEAAAVMATRWRQSGRNPLQIGRGIWQKVSWRRGRKP